MLKLPETITIPVSEYQELLETQLWMDALDAAGIDNAEAYDYACNVSRDMYPNGIEAYAEGLIQKRVSAAVA